MNNIINLQNISFGNALLIKDYFEKTTKYTIEYGSANSIVLMQVGSFFEVYGLRNTSSGCIVGSNIIEFARICDLNVVDKNVSLKDHVVVMAGFKDFIIDKYVKKLQDAGFTSIVFTQDEIIGNTTTRSLHAIYSPGTYFSTDSTHITNNTLCIWVNVIESSILTKKSGNSKKIYVGAANINIYTGKSSIFEFNEIYINNPATFDELERFVSIYTPTEAIVIANLSLTEIEDIISYSNIQCNCIHKLSLLDETNPKNKQVLNCEKQTYQRQILEKFYKTINADVFIQNFNDDIIALQAFCYLLDFIHQHNPNLIHKISEPTFENCGDRLILANHSLKQLNIIDDNNYSGKYSSVLKMLNCCITPMGKRSFSHSFLNPTTNQKYLQQEYDITEHLLVHSDYMMLKIKERLTGIKDLSKINRQIMLKKITPETLYHLYKNIKIIQTMYSEIQLDTVFIQYLESKIENLSKLVLYCNELTNFIETHFIIDIIKDIDSFQHFETNFINKNIDALLDSETQTLIDSTDKLECCRNYLNQLVANYEKKTKATEFIKIHETEKNNFSLIATDRRCKILQTLVDSSSSTDTIRLTYISSYDGSSRVFDMSIFKNLLEFHKQTASNNSITTPQINQLCKSINNIKTKMKDLITKVYEGIINKLENYTEHFDCVIQFVTFVDVIFSKAYVAKKYNYSKPTICSADKSFVSAKNIRHCLIENLQENELYVANDISLGESNGIDGILLYGTNAVGKTSLIRALGISVIMAQSGLYVPASSFNYCPYKYIFTRILGNDNIFKGLSTFAVEMSELRTILRFANSNSLILGDELCSGTESISAISIFVAGIQKLHQIQSSFIFATHIHEIVNYDEIKQLHKVSLKHMSVQYDRERDMLIYDRKLRDGSGDNMYGLEVCKSLSLPPDFLNSAHEIRIKYFPATASILSLKTSHYNANKIMGSCEKCKTEIGTEVHHLLHQKDANIDGVIQKESLLFHKNHLANLITLCDNCHKDFHNTKKVHKKVKTNKGVSLIEISNNI